MFIYKLLVSNYLRRLEACRAGFQACAECNPYTSRGVEILTIPGQSLLSSSKIFPHSSSSASVLDPTPSPAPHLLLQLLLRLLFLRLGLRLEGRERGIGRGAPNRGFDTAPSGFVGRYEPIGV